MRVEKRPCLVCGVEMEFLYMGPEDEGKTIPKGFPWAGQRVDGDEVGWFDAECRHCGFYAPYDMVESRMAGKLEGFLADLDDEGAARNWLRIVLQECPEARELARGVLEGRGES